MEECRCKSEKVGIFCDQAGCKCFVCLECMCSQHQAHRTLTFSGLCKQMLTELEALVKEKQLQVGRMVKEQLDQCFAKLNVALEESFMKLRMTVQTLLDNFVKSTRLGAIQQFLNDKSNLTATKDHTPEVSALLAKVTTCYNKREYNLLPQHYSQYVDLTHQIQESKKKENSVHRFKGIIESDYETINAALKNFQNMVVQLQQKVVKEIPKSKIVFHPSATKELNEYYLTFPPTKLKPYVYFWKADSLFIYFLTQKKVVYGLDYLTEYSFGCCMWKNKIYFSGGGKSEEYYAKTMECEIRDGSAASRALADMLKPKCSHTLVAFNGGYVFSLGGFIDRRDNNYCEAYNVEKNRWSQIKPLSEPKAYVVACTFLNRYVYCIGGRGCTQMNSIEVYDGLSPEDGWSSHEVAERIDSLTKNNYGAAIQSSIGSIIILSRSTLFDYNVGRNRMAKRCDVNAEDLGLEIVPVLYKSWIYQIAKRSPKPYIEAFSTLQKKTSTIEIDQT